jgi:hypothetical protein
MQRNILVTLTGNISTWQWLCRNRPQLPLSEYSFILLIRIAGGGGGAQTGSTRHVGHSWPTVSAPGDCELSTGTTLCSYIICSQCYYMHIYFFSWHSE